MYRILYRTTQPYRVYFWQAAIPALGAVGAAASRYGPRLGQLAGRWKIPVKSGAERAWDFGKNAVGYHGGNLLQKPTTGAAYNAPKYENQLNAANRLINPHAGTPTWERGGQTGGGGAGGDWSGGHTQRTPQFRAEDYEFPDDTTMPKLHPSQKYWGAFLND